MEIYLQFLKSVGYVFMEVISDIITNIILLLRNMKNKFTTYLLKILQVLFHPKILLVITIFMFLVDYILFKLLGDQFEEKSILLHMIFIIGEIYMTVGFVRLLVSKLKTVKWYKSISLLLCLTVLTFIIYFRITEPHNNLRSLNNLISFSTIVLFLATIVLIFKNIAKYSTRYSKDEVMLNPFESNENYPTYKSKYFYPCLTVFLLALFLYQNYSSNIRLNNIEQKLGGKEKIACNDQQTVDRVRKSVVRVVGGVSEGSGFSVKENVILTNFHVVEFEPSPKIIFPDNSFETGTIIMADKNADLAMIRISKNLPVLTLGDSKKLVGAEELLAIGFPFGGDLTGESSVNKGSFSGRRRDKTTEREFIQTDTTLNPGVSGGPMTNECGEVMGVNTAGTAGLGLAISSETIRKKWLDMALSKDSLKDIVKITFEPNKSPIDNVAAFYNYLKIRRLHDAFVLLSDNFKKGYDYDYWKQGYEDLLDTTVIKIEDDKNRENFVHVKLATKNLTDEEIQTKFFEGYWEVRKVGDDLLLWEANIQEIENPDYSWFYE